MKTELSPKYTAAFPLTIFAAYISIWGSDWYSESDREISLLIYVWFLLLAFSAAIMSINDFFLRYKSGSEDLEYVFNFLSSSHSLSRIRLADKSIQYFGFSVTMLAPIIPLFANTISPIDVAIAGESKLIVQSIGYLTVVFASVFTIVFFKYLYRDAEERYNGAKLLIRKNWTSVIGKFLPSLNVSEPRNTELTFLSLICFFMMFLFAFLLATHMSNQKIEFLLTFSGFCITFTILFLMINWSNHSRPKN